MANRVLLIATACLLGPGSLQAPFDSRTLAQGKADHTKPGGYIIQRDADVAEQQPGPHKGGGQTIGHSFFSDVKDLSLVFRKRVLNPGSSIGYHRQSEDEIYYILSGRGVMTLDGKDHEVGPGTAILTRTGSSHGLKTAGGDDLVIIINYLQPTNPGVHLD